MSQQAENASLRLRHFRYKSGLSAAKLSSLLKVSRASYYRYEHGEIFKLETIQEIAVALEITFEQVIAPLSDEEMLLISGVDPSFSLEALTDSSKDLVRQLRDQGFEIRRKSDV